MTGSVLHSASYGRSLGMRPTHLTVEYLTLLGSDRYEAIFSRGRTVVPAANIVGTTAYGDSVVNRYRIITIAD